MIVYTQNTDGGKYVQIPRLSAKLLNQYFKSTRYVKFLYQNIIRQQLEWLLL